MHTAICSFEDRAQAEQAVQRLLEAGFHRSDVHLTHRHADGTEMKEPANDTWDGLEREVAVDRGLLRHFGNFFSSLFGQDDPDGHTGYYSDAVDRGLYVVVVDGRDDAEGERAQEVLHGMNPSDLKRLHRANQPPLRDIVGERQAAGLEQRFGTARSEMGGARNMDMRSEAELPRERATASQGWGEQRKLDIVSDESDDAQHAPGLRYADKDDKPR
jgi:hypothetical protein